MVGNFSLGFLGLGFFHRSQIQISLLGNLFHSIRQEVYALILIKHGEPSGRSLSKKWFVEKQFGPLIIFWMIQICCRKFYMARHERTTEQVWLLEELKKTLGSTGRLAPNQSILLKRWVTSNMTMLCLIQVPLDTCLEKETKFTRT